MLTEDVLYGGTIHSPDCTCVCAVIVTYNIGEAIHKSFDSISRQVGHVIIVDNGSNECTRQEPNKLASADSVAIILNERNEGIAGAFNQGVKAARGKLLLFGDGDIVPSLHLVTKHLAWHQKYPGTFCGCPGFGGVGARGQAHPLYGVVG